MAMKARSPKDFCEDIARLAASSLKDHVILEDVEVNEKEGWWVIGRPEDSAYRVQICVLKWGSLLVHGDIDPVMFGHFRDRRATREAVVRWIARSNIDYVEEKANIGMGRSMCRREHEVMLWQVEDRIRNTLEDYEGDIEKLSATEKRRLIMWNEVKDMIKNEHNPDEIDDYIYSTTSDSEDILSGAVTEIRVLWAYYLLRKLVELIDARQVDAQQEAEE